MIKYDDNGNAIEYRYYGLDEKLINRNDYGCAIIRREYDELNHVVKEECLNESSKPAIDNEFDYASITYKYDDNGNKIEYCYYGKNSCDHANYS